MFLIEQIFWCWWGFGVCWFEWGGKLYSTTVKYLNNKSEEPNTPAALVLSNTTIILLSIPGISSINGLKNVSRIVSNIGYLLSYYLFNNKKKLFPSWYFFYIINITLKKQGRKKKIGRKLFYWIKYHVINIIIKREI